MDRRYKAKVKLTYDLYKRGWKKQQIIDLYTFLDYVLALPKELELNYLEDIEQIEGENKVQYITSAERIGMERGRKKGIEEGIEKGVAKGRKEGVAKGRAEMQKMKESIALKLLQEGLTQKQVAKVTGLSAKIVQTLGKKKPAKGSTTH